MPATGQHSGFEFGVFQLDLRARELRKHGVRFKLQEQPLRILALLLERAGEVVTREDIQKRLWADEIHVDFDNAISGFVDLAIKANFLDASLTFEFIIAKQVTFGFGRFRFFAITMR